MKKYGKKKFVFESNLERSNFNISFKSECKIELTIKILLKSLVINLDILILNKILSIQK